jgi:hypothetical protein
VKNSAVWIKSTPDGYVVRVQFLPMNAAEAARAKRLLKNFTVQVGVVTSEGPLSVDLIFTDGTEAVKPPAPSVDIQHIQEVDAALVAEHKADVAASAQTTEPAALTPAQQAAAAKPDPTDKPA